MSERRTVKVEALTRVEGEGAMVVHLEGERVTGVELRIYEPPRFFEGLLRGRHLDEVPDITARICGICPVAYQMSACQALEMACGVRVPAELRALRRLLYCGEWIESHTLHIYMLHAPDFLGYDGIIPMARDHAAAVERGLRLKKAGNALVALLGGREIHPINVRPGGCYRAPSRAEVRALREPLLWARDAALETVRWTAGFPFPSCRRDYQLLALVPGDEYPIDRGELGTSGGARFPAERFAEHVREEQVPHSNALHAYLDGAPYLTGPLARYGLSSAHLLPVAREAAAAAGLGEVCRNPYRSIVVRAVEVLHACEEALRLIAEYEPPSRPAVPCVPRAGVGHGATEAPRGLLYHRYQIDDEGLVVRAEIVPPTSQNQKSIEQDLLGVASDGAALPTAELTLRCEQAIRNHDPCISCATHFLELEVKRR